MIIGVTGGVGCGKSAVMALLRDEFGARIIQADNVGHEVMKPGEAAYYRIVEHFGTDMLDETGAIDRRRLGACVFNDKAELEFLNSVIHPAVKYSIIKQIEDIRKESRDEPFIAIEAALLLEDNYDAICDKVIYVYADEAVRRQRLKDSRGYTDEKIDSIMHNQMSEAEFIKRCDDTLDNSKNLSITVKNLQKIVDKYKGL